LFRGGNSGDPGREEISCEVDFKEDTWGFDIELTN